jgi:hypothetical protein
MKTINSGRNQFAIPSKMPPAILQNLLLCTEKYNPLIMKKENGTSEQA